MKRVILILMMFSAYEIMLVQEVESRPFAENHKLWVQVFCNYKREYFTEGDTIISGKKCYRLFEINKKDDVVTDQRYFGAIFDEGKKSYFISPNEETAKLLFDFDISEGAHFYIDKNELWVEKDTIIQSCDRFYHRMFIHNLTYEWKNDEYGEWYYIPGYWIEGIGSSSPYFSIPYLWIGTLWFQFAECYVEGELIWRDPRYNPQDSGIETIPDSPFPIPNFAIYNLSGHKFNNELLQSNTAGLPKGVYIQNGKKFVKK